MKAYVATIHAVTGLLLGGVKNHSSAPFETWDMAEGWYSVAIQANKEEGRNVKNVGIREVDVPEGHVIRRESAERFRKTD